MSWRTSLLCIVVKLADGGSVINGSTPSSFRGNIICCCCCYFRVFFSCKPCLKNNVFQTKHFTMWKLFLKLMLFNNCHISSVPDTSVFGPISIVTATIKAPRTHKSTECFYCTTLFYSSLYCTTLYYTSIYCTTLYSTSLYCTTLYFPLLYCNTLYSTLLYCNTLYSTSLYCTTLYSTLLYCNTLYSPSLYCSKL